MNSSWEDIEQKGLSNIQAVKAGLDKVKKIQLVINRRWFTSNSSIGKLYINGLLYCYTLEDVTREGEKIKKETSIPYGIYKILMTVSGIAYKWNTPGNILPLVDNVKNFSGIRLHPGTEKNHTEGCILEGFTRTEDKIGKSLNAFWPLFNLLAYAWEKGYPITLKITNQDRQVSLILLIILAVLITLFLARFLIKYFKK